MLVFDYRPIVLFIGFNYLSFLKMTKIKAIKEEIQNNTKFGLTQFNAKNKYSLFRRTLSIAVTICFNEDTRVIKLDDHKICTGQKCLPKNYLLQASIVQSRFKLRLFGLHVFFAFFIFLRVLRQFRVRKIFLTNFFAGFAVLSFCV